MRVGSRGGSMGNAMATAIVVVTVIRTVLAMAVVDQRMYLGHESGGVGHHLASLGCLSVWLPFFLSASG